MTQHTEMVEMIENNNNVRDHYAFWNDEVAVPSEERKDQPVQSSQLERTLRVSDIVSLGLYGYIKQISEEGVMRVYFDNLTPKSYRKETRSPREAIGQGNPEIYKVGEIQGNAIYAFSQDGNMNLERIAVLKNMVARQDNPLEAIDRGKVYLGIKEGLLVGPGNQRVYRTH